ncbi:MAG: STAS domain-containing protein [Terrimicrobiaceae bacterium]|jgi:anti-anti-sigma factor
MTLTSVDLDNGIRQITLEGRLDIAGSGEIDLKFSAFAAGDKSKVLVDLSKVDFISSIGIRTLLSAARGRKNKGGTLVLCAAQPLVAQVIETAGLGALIPSAPDVASGIDLLNASA